jgi:hypothetical protein
MLARRGDIQAFFHQKRNLRSNLEYILAAHHLLTFPLDKGLVVEAVERIGEESL